MLLSLARSLCLGLHISSFHELSPSLSRPSSARALDLVKSSPHQLIHELQQVSFALSVAIPPMWLNQVFRSVNYAVLLSHTLNIPALEPIGASDRDDQGERGAVASSSKRDQRKRSRRGRAKSAKSAKRAKRAKRAKGAPAERIYPAQRAGSKRAITIAVSARQAQRMESGLKMIGLSSPMRTISLSVSTAS